MNSGFCVMLAAFLALCVHAKRRGKVPVLKEMPLEVLFRDHVPLELDCAVEGDATRVKYIWIKDEKPFNATGKATMKRGKLIFREPKPEDEGDYRCFVTSKAGIASSRYTSARRTYLNDPEVCREIIYPMKGKPFKLACTVPDGYPVPIVKWQKKLDNGTILPLADGRTTVSPDGDLYFSNATKNDVSTDFKYICTAKSPAVDDAVILAEYSVGPLMPNLKPDHKLVQQYVTPDHTVLEAGAKAYLYCIYGGSPLAVPKWYKDGNIVKATKRVAPDNDSFGKRLFIREVQLEDQGEYTCIMNNKFAKEQRYVFQVDVISAPKFTRKPAKRVKIKKGRGVLLPCEVRSEPPAESLWTYNAAPLLKARARPGAKGLTMIKLQKSDRGYYGCKAQNEHGKNYVETFLLVT